MRASHAGYANLRLEFSDGSGPHRLAPDVDTPQMVTLDELRNKVRIAAERVRLGRSTQSLLLVGRSGVDKAVLLDRIRDDLEASGIKTLRIEASKNRSLPALLVPTLRETLLSLSSNSKARESGHRALRAVAGFADAMKSKYLDIEVGIDFDPEPGLADHGILESDLQDLLEAAGQAARKADTALVIFIDELQSVEEEQLAALIVALHRTAQRRLPVMLVGSGLPQLRARVGDAKPYAERMFEFYDVRAVTARSSTAEDIDPHTALER